MTTLIVQRTRNLITVFLDYRRASEIQWNCLLVNHQLIVRGSYLQLVSKNSDIQIQISNLEWCPCVQLLHMTSLAMPR